ncbi:uncharacterized protein BJ171DRAFT_518035 [Polychytrium aggregatum]|uniref:uncharacterized protein n=1 Tax=Polychytrium aggregatum TaxID=110093 RepID=UPI0022FF2539|nr:uncharacterized protein BJ171DRAFT_518035 [Polychytrium aggregatum]KAI9199603.1 hypothetical protein BJ171DRAFT_518035 [Polychytrium aggregatum]
MQPKVLLALAAAMASASTAVHAVPVAGTCGGGSVGNGICQDPSLCCSQWGWCGSGPSYCTATSSAATSSKTTTTSTTTTPAKTTTTPTTTTVVISTTAITTTSSPASSPTAGARIPVIKSCVTPGVIAITYDDGPVPNTASLLDILKQNNIKATFFINGLNWADTSVDPQRSIVQRMYNEGHQIGHHTMNHAQLDTLSVADIQAQMNNLDVVIKNIIGVRPTYMRPPYGAFNNNVLDVLTSLGFRYAVTWNCQSDDYDHAGDVAANMASLTTGSSVTVNQYVGPVYGINSTVSNPARDSYIILNHDTYSTTVAPFTQQMIDYLKGLNFRFVTLAECLGEPLSAAYRS